MNYQTILKLQKKHGLTKLQNDINSGLCWKLEGSYGKSAMDALKNGACVLPKISRYDFYGNLVPSRYMVKSGTAGSYKNCVNFWNNIVEFDNEF